MILDYTEHLISKNIQNDVRIIILTLKYMYYQ